MAYIFQDSSKINKELGKISKISKTFNKFNGKIHRYSKCNIEIIDIIIDDYIADCKRQNKIAKIGVNLIKLPYGIEIRFHTGMLYHQIGIYDKDILGWKVKKDDDLWFLFIITETNYVLNKSFLTFSIRPENVNSVQQYFQATEYKEYK